MTSQTRQPLRRERSRPESVPDDHDANDTNEVLLRGRLAATPELRTLPSGDELVAFRVNVRRPKGDRTRVDSIDCAATGARVRRSLLRGEAGDEFELTGRLHRRFWRSGSGASSRYEVVVATAKLIRRRSVA